MVRLGLGLTPPAAPARRCAPPGVRFRVRVRARARVRVGVRVWVRVRVRVRVRIRVRASVPPHYLASSS